MSKVTPNTLTEKHVARLLERSKGDDLARYRRLATAMEAERDPIATMAAERLCEAINARSGR